MKKKMSYLLPVIAVMLFASCKRDYTCVCTSTMMYEIESATNDDAKVECDTHDNICPPGVVCVTSWDCELE